MLELKLLDKYGRCHRLMQPRWRAKATAQLFGWFWLPCPSCGEHFAGFETATDSIVVTDTGMFCTCPRPACLKRGQEEHRKVMGEMETLVMRRVMDGP